MEFHFQIIAIHSYGFQYKLLVQQGWKRGNVLQQIVSRLEVGHFLQAEGILYDAAGAVDERFSDSLVYDTRNIDFGDQIALCLHPFLYLIGELFCIVCAALRSLKVYIDLVDVFEYFIKFTLKSFLCIADKLTVLVNQFSSLVQVDACLFFNKLLQISDELLGTVHHLAHLGFHVRKHVIHLFLQGHSHFSQHVNDITDGGDDGT